MSLDSGSGESSGRSQGNDGCAANRLRNRVVGMSETPSQTNHPDQPDPEQTRPIVPDPVNPGPDLPGPDPVREQPDLDEPGPDPAVDQAELDQPELDRPEAETDQPIPDELISPELAPRLTLDDIEPEPPAAPDLEAVTSAPPAAPEAPATPPSLDLPGIDYAEHSARLAYGQPTPTPPPASTPQPPPAPTPPADPYAASPYSTQPPPYGGQVPYTSQAAYADPSQPQYGQAQYNQPQFGQPAAYPPVPYQQLNPTDESTWATAAHWSAILASFVGLGFLGPLLVLLIQGPKSARVRANAVESLNFEITYVIAMLASLLLMLVFVGFVTIVVFPILWLILRIVASVQTGGGRDYRYPVNIRLVK